MHGGHERGGRVLVVADGGHGPLAGALSADGHEVDTRLPAEALGPVPDVIVVVRADPAAAVLASLERRAQVPVAPVIVLSGAAPPKVRASLLRAGAHTCLRDPVDPGELLAAVAGALAVKRSRDAEPEAEGLTDPVTGLGNRRSESASSTSSSPARRATATRSRWWRAASTASRRSPRRTAPRRPTPSCTTPARASPARCAAAT